MAFRDFTFPDVQHDLGLTMEEAHLYNDIAPVPLPTEFVERIREGIELARGTNTEKARSEFAIAPVLFQVRQMLKNSVGLFSGIEFNVDPERGLNGYCDFIIARSPRTVTLVAPVIAVAEAKNDNLQTGLGQCVAAMVAAREFNAKAKSETVIIHGVVTTGELWGFLRLTGNELVYDPRHYYATELDRIVAILIHMLQTV